MIATDPAEALAKRRVTLTDEEGAAVTQLTKTGALRRAPAVPSAQRAVDHVGQLTRQAHHVPRHLEGGARDRPDGGRSVNTANTDD